MVPKWYDRVVRGIASRVQIPVAVFCPPFFLMLLLLLFILTTTIIIMLVPLFLSYVVFFCSLAASGWLAGWLVAGWVAAAGCSSAG